MPTATKTTTFTVRYCSPCAHHDHRHCNDVLWPCECGARDHNPTPAVAADMRRYEAPDLYHLDDTTLASQWHRKDEAR